MNHKLFKEVISLEEAQILSNWIIQNYNTSFFDGAGHARTIRKTTRGCKQVPYPEIVFSIQTKIDEIINATFNIDHIERVPYSTNGMYASYGQVGDACKVHIDPRYIKDHVTYHFNVMLTDYENALLYIEDELINIKKLDGVLYPVSEVRHYTTKLTGNNPRLFWCFGYCVPLEKARFEKPI